MRDLAFGERQRELQPLDLGRVAFVRAVAFGNRPVDGTFKMFANAICRRSLVGPDRDQHLLDLGKPDVGNRQVANDRFDVCFQPRPDLAGVPFGFPFLLHHRDVGLGGLITVNDAAAIWRIEPRAMIGSMLLSRSLRASSRLMRASLRLTFG